MLRPSSAPSNIRHRRGRLILGILAMTVFMVGSSYGGSTSEADETSKAAVNADDAPSEAAPGFLEIATAGGPVGYVIMLLSIAAAALVIEHAITIRRKVLMPPELADRVHDLLKQANVVQAQQQCKLQPSFLAYVLDAGIAEIDSGYSAIEKALEDATAEQAARLMRKIEFLSVIGNIAPMLGLLGTVIGMIFAFQEVANTQGAARAADLAEGIYLALVTTVEGLLVAIPALAAYAVFRNRVDQLVAEVASAALHTFNPLKQRHRLAPPRTTPRNPPADKESA